MAEHTLYKKQQLCYTEVIEFTDFQGIGRDPLYKRFDSVYSVIEKNIEYQYRDFLAHPIYSEEDKILWYVREWKNTPCLYKKLPESERKKYSDIKEKTLLAYHTVCDKLTGEDKQILLGAIKYINDDFIFCYDDKIVVVAWGMRLDTDSHDIKGSVIHDLQTQCNHKIKFEAGEHGTLLDNLLTTINREEGTKLTSKDLPEIISNQGYEFSGWEPDPLGIVVDKSMTFVAQYKALVTEDKENLHKKVKVSFVAENGGNINGISEIEINKGDFIDNSQIPVPVPNEGFKFKGWNFPLDVSINEDTIFSALFDKETVTCKFVAGENGEIDENNTFTLPYGSILKQNNIPSVKAKEGYKFTGWDKSPINYNLTENTEFKAQYEKKNPWYKRFWNWLIGLSLFKWFKGKGCLKWLLWILLFVLLTILLSYLFKNCNGNSSVERSSQIETPDGRLIDDNGTVRGVVDDNGRIPDNNIVAPIVDKDGEKPPIISNPGTPDIISNRLNIYFETENVNIEQFIADLSKIYPQEQCLVIGIDHHIPMIQILIQENMRDVIRENLNNQLPNYDFFVVDESIFVISGEPSLDTKNVGWHLDVIDLEEGWKITKGNSDIIVAVVDDGIDANHDMFKNRITRPYNVFSQDNKLSTGQGHGTHVAGLAVGSDKMFDKGVSGIAPKCQLMPVQVFDNGLCTFSSLASGIMYAIHNGANVVNVSVGSNFNGLDVLPIPEQDYIAKTQFKNEERVWRRIINVANKYNTIIVFAVGNNHILANIPPANRTNSTINVVAVNEQIQGTDFTNYGQGSNISAPGQNILSSVPNNDYAVFSGTSMAAPIVSGTIALMKSCKPEISIEEVLQILQATGEQISHYIPPMIQVDDALNALITGKIPAVIPPVDKENGQEEDNVKPANPSDNVHIETGPPSSNNPSDGTDYDAIRKLIEEYKQKIKKLEELLPENN